ncbi:MAG: antitoxin [Deltaproteobacteria bacterium]|nr:antitoxin [Deltaproteobacteria bacterium]
MRTTLTLEPDVARLLEEEAHRQRKPFKHVVNEAIRRGLTQRVGRRASPRYRVTPHRTSLRPGLDPVAFNKLSDELEDEAVLGAMVRRP